MKQYQAKDEGNGPNMVKQILDNVYCIEVVLPENPLKMLNSYFFKGDAGEQNLLVDTGFRRDECWSALRDGLKELDASPENTDVFLTHLHSDHTGNAGRMQKMGFHLMMSDIYNNILQNNNWGQRKERSIKEGFSRNELETVFCHNPAVIYSSEPFRPIPLQEGQCLHYAGRTFECVLTPGHTKGHMCLLDRENKLMVLGDHVLFDITPNITSWTEGYDPLHLYIESLRRVMDLEIVTPLPGHRTTGGMTLRERAIMLINHHDSRLKEVINIVDKEPGLTAYQIAARMKWSIRAKNWDDFPPGQKWFAVGECLAHLEFLLKEQMIQRKEADVNRYYLA